MYEYFFKTSNVQQRNFWIKALTKASKSVCQMACSQCCTKDCEDGPKVTENDDHQSDTNEVALDQLQKGIEDVFYVEMMNSDEGATFVNALSDENENVAYIASKEMVTGKTYSNSEIVI